VDANGNDRVQYEIVARKVDVMKKSWLTVRAMEKGAKGVAEALEADLSPAETRCSSGWRTEKR